MNVKIKTILAGLLLLVPLALAIGCTAEENPYEKNDKNGYQVSVKYDANGGEFATNTFSIVDSYNIDKLPVNSDGKAEIALIAPDDEARGDHNYFEAKKNGYFLAGWYASRTESGIDEDGNTIYSYSHKWDFENDRFTVDKSKQYTSFEPVVTLYAVWAPVFTIEYYSRGDGTLLETVNYDPTAKEVIKLPAWNKETGKLDMNSVPVNPGSTFEKAYYDAEGTMPIDDAEIMHTGTINAETGVAENPNMKIYVDWISGDWYHIYTAQQFVSNANLSANYVIHEDLDFTDVIWPTAFVHGNFSGSIAGNGHTFKNISFKQNNNGKNYAGLFGNITEKAALADIIFENVTFTIAKGARSAGSAFGLLAGNLNDSAAINDIKIVGSTVQIDSASNFGTEDYVIGLLCGIGGSDNITYTGEIECEVVGSNPEKYSVTLDGDTVVIAENNA